MSALYPLKFKTIYKDKIWGGQKIKTYLHKDFGDLPNCGETWEISGVKSDVSVVANGELAGESLADLLEKFQGELVGEKVYAHSEIINHNSEVDVSHLASGVYIIQVSDREKVYRGKMIKE